MLEAEDGGEDLSIHPRSLVCPLSIALPVSGVLPGL